MYKDEFLTICSHYKMRSSNEQHKLCYNNTCKINALPFSDEYILEFAKYACKEYISYKKKSKKTINFKSEDQLKNLAIFIINTTYLSNKETMTLLRYKINEDEKIIDLLDENELRFIIKNIDDNASFILLMKELVRIKKNIKRRNIHLDTEIYSLIRKATPLIDYTDYLKIKKIIGKKYMYKEIIRLFIYNNNFVVSDEELLKLVREFKRAKAHKPNEQSFDRIPKIAVNRRLSESMINTLMKKHLSIININHITKNQQLNDEIIKTICEKHHTIVSFTSILQNNRLTDEQKLYIYDQYKDKKYPDLVMHHLAGTTPLFKAINDKRRTELEELKSLQ